MRILSTTLTAVTFLASLSLAQATPTSKGEKPVRIAHGNEVAIADHIVPGKITIFDFTSEFCPPCRMMEPHLDKLHASRDDLAVVKVDINRPDVKGIDWKSPVAAQYGLRSIPHFKVFGKDGKLMAEGDEARDLVVGWLEM